MKKICLIPLVFLLSIALCGCGEVENAERLISEIGDVQISSISQIEEAEKAVSQLTSRQKARINNLDKLEAARAEYDSLQKLKSDNANNIKQVENKITYIGDVTLEKYDLIINARRCYDSLDPAVQIFVGNRDTLFSAEEVHKQLEITAVTEAIDNIGSVTLESENLIENARSLYDKYQDNIQSEITNIDKLLNAESVLNDLKVERAYNLIEAIGTVTLDSKESIQLADEAFSSVPANERSRIKNSAILSEARTTYKALEDEQKRQQEIEDAKKLIRVTKVAVSSPDSAGGVMLYFNFVNNSDKTIKYLHFGVTFYNAVNDVVLPNYDKQAINYCQETGPYKKGEGLSGTNWYWGKYYSFDIKTVKLVYLEIDYADGTTVTFTKDQVDGVQY